MRGGDLGWIVKFQGKEILEFFIDELLKSGVTYIPPFESKDSVSTADSAIDISKERTEEEEG